MRALAASALFVAACLAAPTRLEDKEIEAAGQLLTALALRQKWLWRRPRSYALPFAPPAPAGDAATPEAYLAALRQARVGPLPPDMPLAPGPAPGESFWDDGVIRIVLEGGRVISSGLMDRAEWRRDLAQMEAIARDPEVRSLSQDRLHVLSDTFHAHRRATLHEERRSVLAAHAAERPSRAALAAAAEERTLLRTARPLPRSIAPPSRRAKRAAKRRAAAVQARSGAFRGAARVDTHVHLAAAFTPTELVRFLRAKLLAPGAADDLVDATGRTLAELLRDEGLPSTPQELTERSLALSADATFERFDRFDELYLPGGSQALRALLLKHSNEQRLRMPDGRLLPTPGRYLAELLRAQLLALEATPRVFKEMRISVKGTARGEWEELARWAARNDLFHPQLRWVVQVPRNYREFREAALERLQAADADRGLPRRDASAPVFSYLDQLRNIFTPLVAATAFPARHRELHGFLAAVVALDSVSDESRPDADCACDGGAAAADIDAPGAAPSYANELFHLAANLAAVNALREERGMSTFALRPHAGEAGAAVPHLAAALLVAEAVGHGINLRHSPSLQYLAYLCRLPLAMTPVSNNRLFLRLDEHPFGDFFRKGLVVSLGTDDPAFLALTDDALLEEYATAAHRWRLSPADLAEIARNSVLTGGLEAPTRARLIGGEPPAGAPMTHTGPNDPLRTGVPARRVAFRAALFEDEWATITGQATRDANNEAGARLAAAHGLARAEPRAVHAA